MPSTLRRGLLGENVRTSELCPALRGFSAQAPCELGARAHAELGVDVREMARDRPLAEEQGGRDLAVRLALGDQHGHAPLGGGQPTFSRTAADAAELVARLVDPRRCADLLEAGERGG